MVAVVSPRLRSRYGKPWWAAVDSNHLPPRYQHGALPVELAARRMAGAEGFEPSALGFGDRCSDQTELRP